MLALAWLIAAALLGLGGAGLIARADNFAGDQARPELSWRYDQAMAPGIASAAQEAAGIADSTDKLADAARSALVHLLGGETKAVADDLSRGEVWAADISRRGPIVESLIAQLPYVDSPQLVSSGTRDKIAALHQIVDATRPLTDRWRQLEQATVPAVDITAVLQSHDATVLADAIVQLDRAAAMRDQLTPVVEVTTLPEWIDRSRAHDEALQEVYTAIMGGKADEIAAAVAKQKAAEALLPPDTRALVVILGDIALGGVNQAAIAVESVRGTLATALATLD